MATKAKRGAAACTECGKAHARCNGATPCERCVSKNLSCVYGEKCTNACDNCKLKHRKCNGEGGFRCSACVSRLLSCVYSGHLAKEREPATGPFLVSLGPRQRRLDLPAVKQLTSTVKSFAEVKSYFDSFMDCWAVGGLQFSAKDYQNIISGVATSKSAFFCAVLAIGAFALGNLDEASKLDILCQQYINRMTVGGTTEPFWLGCAMYSCGQFGFILDGGTSERSYAMVCEALRHLEETSARKPEGKSFVILIQCLLAWMNGTLHGDSKAIVRCSRYVTSKSLAMMSDWKTLLTTLNRFTGTLQPREVMLLSCIVLDGAISSLPSHRNRLFYFSGGGIQPTPEMVVDIKTMDSALRSFVDHQTSHLGGELVQLSYQIVFSLLLGDLSGSYTNAARCLDVYKGRKRVQPARLIIVMHMLHAFLLCGKMDEFVQTIDLLFQYGAYYQAEKLARDLHLAFFGSGKRIVDTVLHHHPFSPILVCYEDHSTFLFKVDYPQPSSVDFVVDLLREKEVEWQRQNLLDENESESSPSLSLVSSPSSSVSTIPGILSSQHYLSLLENASDVDLPHNHDYSEERIQTNQHFLQDIKQVSTDMQPPKQLHLQSPSSEALHETQLLWTENFSDENWYEGLDFCV